jgi:hypothetical protein
VGSNPATPTKKDYMIQKILRAARAVITNTAGALYGGLVVIRRHPQILIYPYLAALFILVTYPIVNGIVFKLWSSLSSESIFVSAGEGPEFLRILVGLVAFSAFYAIFITGYFNVAMAAGVQAGLEKRKVSFLYGISQVIKTFPKVTKFAVLAIFFFPLSIIAQRSKLPKGLPGVIGSSLSLSMAQLSPVILTEKLQFVQEHWLDADTAQLIGALTAILLSFTAYVVTKVIGSIFTAVLYHKSAGKNKNT